MTNRKFLSSGYNTDIIKRILWPIKFEFFDISIPYTTCRPRQMSYFDIKSICKKMQKEYFLPNYKERCAYIFITIFIDFYLQNLLFLFVAQLYIHYISIILKKLNSFPIFIKNGIGNPLRTRSNFFLFSQKNRKHNLYCPRQRHPCYIRDIKVFLIRHINADEFSPITLNKFGVYIRFIYN